MGTAEHVHFIGIGGYGMSAIAGVLLEMGYRVTGSDLVSQQLTERLASKGAQVYIGHDAGNVEGADWVVYSTALPRDNVEMAAARLQNIPILHRAEMLARLMDARKGIAVAGAHGKTTTSSMIALVMELSGFDPTFIIGGEMLNMGCNAKAGNGEYVVAEADESDGSFLKYHPTLAVVTNVEADHLEHYAGDFLKLQQAYGQFLTQVKAGGKSILCSDDPILQSMIAVMTDPVITFGIDNEADYRAVNLRLGDRKVAFDVSRKGDHLGSVELAVPGKHNVYNALAAMVVCLEVGIEFKQIALSIHQFTGAKRRFQVVGEVNGTLVIDDYAHHPTEIRATIQAAKATGKRIIAVFQPQRYSRTFFLFDQFGLAFGEADEVIVTDIYSPKGEVQIEGIHSANLVELIRTKSNANVKYIPSKEEALSYLSDHVTSDDLVLTMGAGDIWRAADGLVKMLDERFAV